MERTFESLKKEFLEGPVLAENDVFTVCFATTKEELDEVFRLRYRIFTEEQGRNPGAARVAADMDTFDQWCLQMIVRRRSNREIVGTYRVHFGTVAMTSGMGYYSAQEYTITGMEAISEHTIELGRSCVAPEERDGSAVALLWKGVSELIRRSGRRWLVGCVSLEDPSPVTAWGLFRYLQQEGKISASVKAVPNPGFVVDPAPEAEVAAFAADRRTVLKSIPPLFKGYLRMGAKICGDPAFDREFGTVDFFIELDVCGLPERYRKHFDVHVQTEAQK